MTADRNEVDADVEAYVATQHGEACRSCGVSNADCLRRLLSSSRSRGACCSTCFRTDTHNAHSAAECRGCPQNQRPRTRLDSIAFALCANDESDNPDYGNDRQAELIYAQLVADGHFPEVSK